MEYNRKIFISNIITFIVLLIAFFVTHSYLQELNFESQYRSYIKKGRTDININFSNVTIINNSNETNNNLYKYPAEEFKIGYDLIIPLGVSLILILNTLYYIIQKMYENYYNNKKPI